MNRTELLNTLKQVEPALATKDFIPVYACLCFTGKTVFAYDDVVALEAPLDGKTVGGVRGRLLLDWLGASRARELEVTQEKEGELLIKAGRAKLTAPLCGVDDFVFEWPKEDKADVSTLELKPEVRSALQKASVSMGSDPSHAWRCGVTMEVLADALVFYSSDNKTASKVSCKFSSPKKAVGKKVLLPPRFCELLINIGAGDKPEKLMFTSEWVETIFKSGVRLFSRCMDAVKLKTYEKIFTQTIDAENAPKMVAIPKGFEQALERALVVARFAEDPHTELTVKDGKMVMKTKSPAGDVRDSCDVGNHPDATERLAAEFIQRALPYADKFCIVPGKSCFALRGSGFKHLISVVSDGEEK
jgi:DNA polymerase III sliding clamp (beta) subunit (PCNA family)